VGKAECFCNLLVTVSQNLVYGSDMNDSDTLSFVLIAGLAGTMTLLYFPLRIFLTITARSRRLKLLQSIRRLRDQLAQPLEP